MKKVFEFCALAAFALALVSCGGGSRVAVDANGRYLVKEIKTVNVKKASGPAVTKSFTYDDQGRLSGVSVDYGDGVTGEYHLEYGENSIKGWVEGGPFTRYDLDGNIIICERKFESGNPDPVETCRTDYTYSNGKLKKSLWSFDASEGSTSWQWDGNDVVREKSESRQEGSTFSNSKEKYYGETANNYAIDIIDFIDNPEPYAASLPCSEGIRSSRLPDTINENDRSYDAETGSNEASEISWEYVYTTNKAGLVTAITIRQDGEDFSTVTIKYVGK